MSYPRELTNLPQTGAGVIIDENLAALRSSALYARNYITSTGLTLGYYGGHLQSTVVADGTIALDASNTVYVVAHRTTAVVSKATNTTNWNATSTYGRLYKATTSGSAITALEDWREQLGGIFDHAAGGSGGTVTSVAASVPAFLSVAGSPITTSGTLAISLSGTALPIANGGTGGTSASAARTALGVDDAIAAAVAGLSWKQAVRAATTAAGTLATGFENGDAIDGVTLATGDRILIKNQAAGAENGIYVVAASGAPARATDADTGAELVNASVYVSEGTTLGDTQWTCTTNAPITVGSTPLAFAQLTSGGGSTQGRHDIPIAPGSWYADQTAPPLWAGGNGATDQPDVARWSFDPTTEQAVWCVVQLPKKYNGGTITFDVTWSRGAGTNPTVVWSLRAVAIGDGDAIAANYGTAQTVTDTGATAGNFYRSPESAALTIAGTPQDHDLIFLELRRKPGDASDTFDANAELEMVTLHITTDADTDA